MCENPEQSRTGRRDVLGYIATAGVAGLAGCSGDGAESDVTEGGTPGSDGPSNAETTTETPTATPEQAAMQEWPLFQGQPNNRGVRRRSVGPTSSVTTDWTASAGDAISSSPAVANGLVVVGSQDGSVYAFNEKNGEKQWSVSVGRKAGSPAIASNTVYVGGQGSLSSPGKVAAFATSDGSKQWERSFDKRVLGPIAVVGDTVYFNGENVHALNARTGETNWTYETGVGQGRGHVAVTEDSLYAGDGNGVLHAVDIVDVTDRWTVDFGVAAIGSAPTVVGETVYLSHGSKLYAVGTRNGTEQWSYEVGQATESSPAVLDGYVVFGTNRFGDTNRIYALDEKEGTPDWEKENEARIDSSPAIVRDGYVYIADTGGQIRAIALESGEVAWEYTGDEGVGRSSPAIANGRLYVGTEDGTLLALGE